MNRLVRLFNTVKYLKPIQVFYRVLCFSKRKPIKHLNVEHKWETLFIDGLHDDKNYVKRFETGKNKIELLNSKYEINYENDYLPLINFNLQYFEYGIVWAKKGVPFCFLKAKWNEYLNSKTKLEPYVVSLQIPNLIIAMNAYKVDDSDIFDELYARYRWLLLHQEKHLLANHYFENLKAIIIGAYFFKEEEVYKKHLKKLKKECDEQILNDGVHYELSLMYHKIILEDLLLIAKISEDDWIRKTIQKMLDAAYSLEMGFNRTPLFNDAGDNVAKSLESLVYACDSLLKIKPVSKCCFIDSGYYKLYEGSISVLIDAGYIGPDYNPGHSHCDCLSFEMCIKGHPILVNSGTYQYQGEKRSFFRSTEAHNTVLIDNHEQSEMWGEHRVGKRIKMAHGILEGNSFKGSYLNQFKEKHTRRIILNNGKFSVLDTLEKVKNGKKINSFLHLAPGFLFDSNCIIGPNSNFSIELIDCSVRVIDSLYSDEFGKIESNKCLVFEWLTDEKEHGYIINLNNKENKNG